MRAFGRYILSGRLQAVTTISVLAILSLFVPLLFLFSGVPLGLVVLRKGPIIGLQILLYGMLVLALFTLLMQADPQLVLVYVLAVWLPTYICCTLLLQTNSQGWLVFTASLFAAIYALISNYLVSDLPAWWLASITESLTQHGASEISEQYLQQVEKLMPVLNSIVTASIAGGLIAKSLLARWWQSILFNAGGFKAEFHALRLPREVISLPLLGIGLLYLGVQYWDSAATAGLDILFITVIVYSFQGIAAVHRTVSLQNINNFWLVVMYLLLSIIPSMLLFMAFLGVLDLWVRKFNDG